MIQHLPNKGLLREEPRVVWLRSIRFGCRSVKPWSVLWRVAFPKQKREATKDVSAIPKLLVC
jgi:hypothetical protein